MEKIVNSLMKVFVAADIIVIIKLDTNVIHSVIPNATAILFQRPIP